MSDRSVPLQEGVCDGCGKSTQLYDYMGDLYCMECASPDAEGTVRLTASAARRVQQAEPTCARCVRGEHGPWTGTPECWCPCSHAYDQPAPRT